MNKIILLFLLSILPVSCATFTQEEKKIIYTPANQPAKVLVITNKADSLFLRKKNKEVNKIKNNKDLSALIAKLRLTMQAESGIGIAATQIGVDKKVFLFQRLDKTGFPVEVVVNPRITAYSSSTFCFIGDGCLSIPNQFGNSLRYTWLEVEYYNEKGEKVKEKLYGRNRGMDFTGVIFQHEYDHTQGVLFIDKLCNTLL